jgi:hypothetical protein
MKPKRNILLLASLVALVLSATAASANASPAWKFNKTELGSGVSETVVGGAISSSLSIPGATTECADFLYNMTVTDVGGKGKGEITELPLFECKTTSSNCTVESIEAEKLPWPTHLVAVGSSDYLVVEGVNVGIVYSGKLCALAGSLVRVKGTAGGIVENSTQTAKFDAATFTATGTELKVGASAVEWNGLFPTEAFKSLREEAIEVS